MAGSLCNLALPVIPPFSLPSFSFVLPTLPVISFAFSLFCPLD